MIPLIVGFAGSSNTANASGYRVLTQNGLLADHALYNSTFLNTAVSGWATWANLIKLSNLSTANLVIFDTSNDAADETSHDEAFVRRAWAAGARVIPVLLPAWASLGNEQVNTPANQTALENMRTLCAAYGLVYVDFWAYCQAHVPGDYNLSDLYADTAHPSATGHAIIESLLDDYLPTGGTGQPSPLPTRLYDNGDFEQTPVVKLGTDYDSRTGTWADTGTRTESSTAGSTIVYSGTFRSFGCYRADGGSNVVEVDIDGGGYQSIAFYQNGYDIGTRAAHIITIRIPTVGSCRIDEFWAI